MSTTFTYSGREIFRVQKRKEAEIEEKHGIGTNTEPIERSLRQYERRVKWTEPKSPPALRLCPVCGVLFQMAGRKTYCSIRCANHARKKRERAKKRLRDQEIMNFKPYQGKAGEIYYLTTKRTISFIPAVFCLDFQRINDWINTRYNAEEAEHIKEQIFE